MSENSSSTPSTQTTPSPQLKDKLLLIVKSMQFAWFVGHAFTLLSAWIYIWSIIKGNSSSSLNKLSYKFAYLSIIESFGIIIYQSYKNNFAELTNFPAILLQDDNVEYISIAILSLLILPKISISLSPFVLFSFFHALNYTSNTLLPIFPSSTTSSISLKLNSFSKKFNDSSVYLSACLEITTFFYILTRALIWSKGYWIATVIYGLFIRLRYERSIFTRTAFMKLEVRLDGLASHPSLPPVVKSYWIQFKLQSKKYLKTKSFANDEPSKQK